MRKIEAFLSIFLTASFLAVCIGCHRESAAPAAPTPIADSPQARRMLAEEILLVYPQEKFAADLSEEVESVTGREVLEEARALVRARLSTRVFREKRLEFYSRYFTVAELIKLKELYTSPEGAGLIKALSAHHKAWADFLSPIIMEALSSYPATAVPER